MNNVRFRHFYNNNNGRLIATIATERVGDTMRVAASICHKNDSPVKSRGRQIALARLQKNKGVVEMSFDDYVNEVEDNVILRRFASDYVYRKNEQLANTKAKKQLRMSEGR